MTFRKKPHELSDFKLDEDDFVNDLSKQFFGFLNKLFKPNKPENLIEKLNAIYSRDSTYPNIRLIKDINSELKKGMIGNVLETLHEKIALVEFENQFGSKVNVGNKEVFKLDSTEFEILKEKS